MSFTPILPRVLDALLGGNRVNPLPNAPDLFNDGPQDSHQDNHPRGPDTRSSLPASLDRQLQMRGLDGLPPGLARQLAAPPAPAPSPAPSPLPTSLGERPAAPPTTLGQAIAQTVSAAVSAPAQVLAAVTPAANAGAGNPAAMAGDPDGLPASANARRGGAGPVVQPQAAVAGAAQATPPQAQAMSAGLRAGAANPAVPANAVPGTAMAAAPQASANTTAIPAAARTPEALATQAARADAVPASARTEQNVLDRLVNLLRPASELARQALPALAAREAVQQALPLAVTPPLSAPPPQATADVRLMGVVGNERAVVTRTDTVMAPAYTGTGPARRSGRLDGFQTMLNRMRLALATGADPRDVRNLRPDHGAWFALQWMFWVLAIVAYGCLALAMVALLAHSPKVLDELGDQRVYVTVGFVFVGLLASAGAWWLGRRLSRR